MNAPAIPATPGYEITRFEVNKFMYALGLDPRDVTALHVHKNRAVATLTGGGEITVHIKESRG